jgi:hypothetical protein
MTGETSGNGEMEVKDIDNTEDPPPVLKTWKNLYILVLGNLLLWVALFTLFTWMFK